MTEPVGPPPVEQIEDQVERTLLAWRRTALSMLAAGLLVGHLSAQRVGNAALAAALLGVAAVVAFVWLGRTRSTGVTGLAMVAGTLILAVVALIGVAG